MRVINIRWLSLTYDRHRKWIRLPWVHFFLTLPGHLISLLYRSSFVWQWWIRWAARNKFKFPIKEEMSIFYYFWHLWRRSTAPTSRILSGEVNQPETKVIKSECRPGLVLFIVRRLCRSFALSKHHHRPVRIDLIRSILVDGCLHIAIIIPACVWPRMRVFASVNHLQEQRTFYRQRIARMSITM